MKDEDCVRLLQWVLPRLGMRWEGFRKVRRQVCRRVARRMEEVGCSDVNAYRERLVHDPREWKMLDGLCRVTISRFYRDRHVFDALRNFVLPELARRARQRGAARLRFWSSGCASGEEPYTLSLLFRLELERCFAGLSLAIVGTDIDPVLLERARRAVYPESSLRDLPKGWKQMAFSAVGREGKDFVLDPRFQEDVELRLQDVRQDFPEGQFDLVSCRNLVYTYFEPSLQREIQEKLLEKAIPGGAFVVGEREEPLGFGIEPWIARSGIYRRKIEGRMNGVHDRSAGEAM
jgi:chemotaxis protein methyltransferase CheR